MPPFARGATYVSPVDSGLTFEGFDQGVDYKGFAGAVIRAPGSGRVFAVTGWAVYMTLDQPWTDPSDGTTYSYVYAAETSHPLVNSGDRVYAGQPLAAYGPEPPPGQASVGGYQSEIGFAAAPPQTHPLGVLGTDSTGRAFGRFIAPLGAPGLGGNPVTQTPAPAKPPSGATGIPGTSTTPVRTRPGGGNSTGATGLFGIAGLGGSGGSEGFVETAAEDVWQGLKDLFTGPWEILKLITWLASPKSWLRLVEFVTGMALLLLGLHHLFRLFVASEADQPSTVRRLERAAGLAAVVK